MPSYVVLLIIHSLGEGSWPIYLLSLAITDERFNAAMKYLTEATNQIIIMRL